MPKKKTKLPKDFEARLRAGSLEDLIGLFATHDVEARGGYSKQTALAFADCPDDLARWLVEHGADVNAVDAYGDAPLHARSRHWNGRVDILLRLGADVNRGEGGRGTPLHVAATAARLAPAAALLTNNARVDARDGQGRTPLERALGECSNMQIASMAEVVALLLSSGAQRSERMKADVARIGADFEFHRARFNPDYLTQTETGLQHLYELFDVAPAPRRQMHNGKTPIVAPAGIWQDQHKALWELLVPSSGAAATVQGEAIRISGRIHDELYRNGGANWDRDYGKMAEAFLMHIMSGTPLPPGDRDAAASLVADLTRNGEASRLCELAVAWVAINPTPIALPPPGYRR